MELSVKTLDSHTHIFKDLAEEITVVDFKSHISSTVGLPPSEQRLIFRGRVLQDEKKLLDYNVTTGQVIHLVARNSSAGAPGRNDHPQPSNTSTLRGEDGSILMGAIGTLELPNTSGGIQAGLRRRNSAAARLDVANRCLTRASNLLRTLEEEGVLLQAQPILSGEDEDDDQGLGILSSIHTEAATAVVASIQRDPEIMTPRLARQTPTATNQSDAASVDGAATASTGVTAGTPQRVEAPMLRELAVSINDLIAFNQRLTPYLQTIQIWLAENRDFGSNTEAVQYTYNAVSTILHSVSHSVHAMSDIIVDFSNSPQQRRLCAPVCVFVEQSPPILRATIPIPIGMRVGLDPNPSGRYRNAASTAGNRPASESRPQVESNGVAAAAQIQQAIGGLLQMFMSGQGNSGNPRPPNPPPPSNLPTPPFNPLDIFGAGTSVQVINASNPSNTTRINGPVIGVQQNTQNTSDGSSNASSGTATNEQYSGRNSRPRLENMLLQCQSHHYSPTSTLPPRPANLISFLAEEEVTASELAEGIEILDHFITIVQGLNVIHPTISQYIRTCILRGRDTNNPEHVTTGLRSYARTVVTWIVEAIENSTGRRFDVEGLTSRLNDVVTQLFSKATQALLQTPAGTPVTAALRRVLSDSMPLILAAIEYAFPAPEHLRVFKGLILLIVTTCFPDAPVKFSIQLTAALSDYLIKLETVASEEYEVEHVESELAMEIDVEVEGISEHSSDMSEPEITQQRPTLININGGNTVNSAPVSAANNMDSDDDSDEELNQMTQTLFRDLPEVWHPTLLNDIQKQHESLNEPQELSSGFYALFPKK